MNVEAFLYNKIAKSGSKPITDDDISYYRLSERFDKDEVEKAIEKLKITKKIIIVYYDKVERIASKYPTSRSIIAYRKTPIVDKNFISELFL